MPKPRRRALGPLALVALPGLLACGDVPTDPVAELVAEHAGVALDVPPPPPVEDLRALEGAAYGARLDAFGDWLGAVRPSLASLKDRPVAAVMAAEVTAAGAALDQARALEAAGDHHTSVTRLEQARTHAIAVTAAALADSRIDRAAAAAAGCEGADTADAVGLRRGERLLAHAREALEDGELERALQRAHYAAVLFRRACGS